MHKSNQRPGNRQYLLFHYSDILPYNLDENAQMTTPNSSFCHDQ